MSVIFSDALLSKLWRDLDFEKIARKLLYIQKELTKLAYANDSQGIEIQQKKITNDIEIKALAVYKVTIEHNSGPGIDGILWTSDAEKMQGAMSLNSDDYHAMPFRRVIIEDKIKMKKRYIGIPTIKDRAMQMLYSFILDPISEAKSDKKSFAFRRGRSALDAHHFVSKSLMYPDSDEWIFLGDVKSCYGSISHEWLLKNIPINKKVLKEFLKSGFVFGDKLFPTEQGIALGLSISPILGNMALNGLEDIFYENLNNFNDMRGNFIRYADDIVVISKDRKAISKIKDEFEIFLSERGLKLSNTKSKIVHISEGFNFLSRHYCKINGIFSATPSKKSIKAFEMNLKNYILKRGKSMTQRGLIKGLNAKIHGFASYHRVEDATDIFRHLDAVIAALLLKLVQKQYPKRTKEYLINKFWYEDPDGRKVYALVNRKDIRLFRMADTILIEHKPIRLSKNPYLDFDYFEEKLKNQDIDNVNGKYMSIWVRQKGICYYCGYPILRFQRKKLIHKNSLNDNSIKNMAYIHCSCEDDEIVFIHTPTEFPDNIDIFNIVKEIGEKDKNIKSLVKSDIKPKYPILAEFFIKNTKEKFSLTFNQIEQMLGFKLCKDAYKHSPFWYSRNSDCIPYTWKELGYEVSKIEFKNQKVYFYKVKKHTPKLTIPKVLLNNNMPNEAKFELDKFFKYIIKKYGL